MHSVYIQNECELYVQIQVTQVFPSHGDGTYLGTPYPLQVVQHTFSEKGFGETNKEEKGVTCDRKLTPLLLVVA